MPNHEAVTRGTDNRNHRSRASFRRADGGRSAAPADHGRSWATATRHDRGRDGRVRVGSRDDEDLARPHGETVIRWFGLESFSPACEDLPRVPTPIGEPCTWCAEPIHSTERGYCLAGTDAPTHIECFTRQIAGSLAHQQGRCSCYGGSDSDDDLFVSRRAAAIAAWAWFFRGRPE